MAESQAPAMDIQTALAAIMANIQSVKEDVSKQNKAIREDNKKIYNVMHDQAKQNKQLLEAAEIWLSEKVEVIRAGIETALENNNSWICECEAKITDIEGKVVQHEMCIRDSYNYILYFIYFIFQL